MATVEDGTQSDEYEEYLEEEEVEESDDDDDESDVAFDFAVSSSHDRWTSDEASARKRLIRFFMYYEPSQLKIIDHWLANWRGQEAQLFRELVAYHGPEPSAGSLPGSRIVTSAKQRMLDECLILLRQFFAFYAPERYQDAEDVLHAWSGREAQLRQHLEDQQALRDFVMRHFRTNFPDRITEVPLLLRQWLGHEGELIDHLARSGKGNAPSQPLGMSTNDVPVFADARSKRVQFFRVLDPEKVSEVDAILQFYKGREELLFRSLRRKHLHTVDTTVEGMRDRTRDHLWLNLCKAWNPDALPQVIHMINTHAGTERDFLRDFSEICFGAWLQQHGG
ncbi:MAG: hypothetical protein Q8J97_03875, partial [Flavobacteriaceae bacterium]|nr:hypothetical protein [Flavobacteriaceae bacterium]